MIARIHAVRGQTAEARAGINEAIGLALATRDAQDISQTRLMGFAFGHTLRLVLRWEPLRGNAQFQQLMKEAEARADAQPRAGRARF